MAARRSPRSYESPLRAEQMDRTREKLIQAGIDIVTEAGDGELTLRRVAARAGVSVPTAYRHFADRDALFDAMAGWIDARISGLSVPSSVDGVPLWVRHIYASFEAHDRLMRAQLSTPAGRAVRVRNQKARRPRLVGMAKRSFPAAPAIIHHRMAALLQLLVNVPAWIALHDQWEMGGREAGQLAAWAVETLVAELKRHPSALDFDGSAGPAIDRAAASPQASGRGAGSRRVTPRRRGA